MALRRRASASPSSSDLATSTRALADEHLLHCSFGELKKVKKYVDNGKKTTTTYEYVNQDEPDVVFVFYIRSDRASPPPRPSPVKLARTRP